LVIVKEWFTIEEAAEYLCVSKRTIYKLTEEGRLPFFRIGKERHRRLRKVDLDNVFLPEKVVKSTEEIAILTAKTDPVLAELWNNARDEVYDHF
jgi:excisionase family DNA binding protein